MYFELTAVSVLLSLLTLPPCLSNAAYDTLSFISLLRFPMTLLPVFATMVANALVAIQRIRSFLLRSETKLEVRWYL